jgi:D-alanine-D-alanine ligase-like ATP-grasp enzyme
MPELTSDSMFSSLWKASGLEYSRLLDRLIDLAQKNNF